MTQLLAICQNFSDWQPALSEPSISDRVLGNEVAKNLGLEGTLYIGPNGPYHPGYAALTPINDVIGHITSRTRDAVGMETWRALREKMSERFVGQGFDGLVESVPLHQRDSFFGPGGNPHQLVAWVEDLLLTGFCLAHLEHAPEKDVLIVTDLLVLYLLGIYPVGVAKSSDTNPEISFLVLLHGSEPLLAALNP